MLSVVALVLRQDYDGGDVSTGLTGDGRFCLLFAPYVAKGSHVRRGARGFGVDVELLAADLGVHSFPFFPLALLCRVTSEVSIFNACWVVRKVEPAHGGSLGFPF